MDISLKGISRRYGQVAALDNVSFEARSGSITALVGENGAGKTTLTRLLYGAERPDQGTMEVGGQTIQFHNSADAIRAGIGMVSQHYSIIPELTCLQNLMLGAEPSWGLDVRKAEERATELAKSMGYTFDWRSLAETLSPAGKQKLEILKLLWRRAKVMILDEPTAMLSPLDSDLLFESLTRLAKEGATVIVVTHRLPEVIDFCETVTVLRGGKLVSTHTVAEIDASALAEMIVGHSLVSPTSGEVVLGEPRLGVEGLTVKGYRGDNAVENASFAIKRGEIVGLAGVDGNGQRELFHALVGHARPLSGTITFDGSDWTPQGPSRRIEAGLRLIPEDRHAEGVIEDWSLTENAALGLQRLRPFSRGPWIDRVVCHTAAGRIAEKFRTKHGGLDKPMRSLSGGNQQRFVAARALDQHPNLILAFQPTRGLDIDGTSQVYGAIRAECRKGACALVVSFDLDELLENCDRVIVMNHGHVTSPPEGSQRDRQAIGRLMVGAE